ncbi:MAG: 4Fe-4S dicluster domain-containing protein, partial [Deltaproteobacteria bacterium]|nr:4Fe-4S dicluster domain-containing protein [Deltaproteobacteria bacterium]
MNLGFVIDNRKCIGCHACTVACKAEHSVALGVNRTWVKYIEKGVFPFSRRYFSVHRCNHCENAPCVTICPVGALFTRDNGIVDFDKERCIGCRSCMQACPYDSLYIDPETKTSAKCNYCAHRVEKGIEPSCVVVCPEQAITSGDLDDPESGISRLVSHERVMVRKPEKDTRPKLFYIEAEQTMLRPSAAPPHVIYTQAEQASGVGHYAKNSGRRGLKPRVSGLLPCEPDRPDPAPKAIQARRVYDAPARGVLWGWELPAYLWSKSIGAGLVFITLALQLLGLGELTLRQEWHIAGAGLAMMVLTALFLVKDLDRPGRFIYVLLRPQWKSWL